MDDNLEPEYKIGDLVRIVEIAFLMDDDININIGDIGIVVSLDPDDHDLISLWGVDYMVLIGDRKIMFFSNEIELVEKSDTEIE